MVPWWVYLVVAGIVFSAYMTIRTGREETMRKDVETEEMDSVYMERLDDQAEKGRQYSS